MSFSGALAKGIVETFSFHGKTEFSMADAIKRNLQNIPKKMEMYGISAKKRKPLTTWFVLTYELNYRVRLLSKQFEI